MELSEMNAFIDAHLGAGARLATELATMQWSSHFASAPMTILAIALIYIADGHERHAMTKRMVSTRMPCARRAARFS